MDEHGFIHQWDLLKANDLLRQENAGYTEEYYRYLKHKDEIPDSFSAMFQYQYLTDLTELQVTHSVAVDCVAAMLL